MNKYYILENDIVINIVVATAEVASEFEQLNASIHLYVEGDEPRSTPIIGYTKKEEGFLSEQDLIDLDYTDGIKSVHLQSTQQIVLDKVT